MKDYYAEQVIKRFDTFRTFLTKIVLVVVTCGSVWGVTKSPYWILLTMALVVVDIVLFLSMDIEYEYLYINDELTIDKVMAKSSRRKVFKVNMRDVELVAPMESGEARPYQKTKKKRFSSRSKTGVKYLMIISEDDGCMGVEFEPNEAVLEGMRRYDPKKVFMHGI